MPKSSLYSAILKLLKTLGLCNGTDTLPACFKIRANGELLIDATMLLCGYLRTMESVVSWEDACALLVLTFRDNTRREAAVEGGAVAGVAAADAAVATLYATAPAPPDVDAAAAVANIVEELKNKFATLIVRLYELGVPAVRVLFDGPTPFLKQAESLERRTLPLFATAIEKAVTERSKNSLDGAIKHILSVCTSSVLVAPLVAALRSRFPYSSSSFAASLTIAILIGEADALFAFRSRSGITSLTWTRDAGDRVECILS